MITAPANFSLRAATPADAEFLYALYASTRAAEMAAWHWPEAQFEAFLQLQFRARERHYAAYPEAQEQIIQCDEQPVGRWLLARPAGEIRLVEIALLPAWQRQGIGTQLLLALQETARAEKMPIRLHVAYDNPARHWYARHGFAVLENRETHWLMEWHNPFEENPTMDNLHYDDFLPHCHSQFAVTTNDGVTFEQELISITENSPSPRQEQFVLLFRAPLAAPSQQGLYEVSHPQLGSGALFLVPVKRDAEGLYYEAVFNRPVESL